MVPLRLRLRLPSKLARLMHHSRLAWQATNFSARSCLSRFPVFEYAAWVGMLSHAKGMPHFSLQTWLIAGVYTGLSIRLQVPSTRLHGCCVAHAQAAILQNGLQHSQLCPARDTDRGQRTTTGMKRQRACLEGLLTASTIPVCKGCCIFSLAALHDIFQKSELIPRHIVDAVDRAEIHCLTHSLCIISPLRRDASPPKFFFLHQRIIRALQSNCRSAVHLHHRVLLQPQSTI